MSPRPAPAPRIPGTRSSTPSRVQRRGVLSLLVLMAAVVGFLPALPAAAQAADVTAQDGAARFVGNWEGRLEAGPQSLPILFHLVLDGDGLSATMDSPAQGAMGVPMDPPEIRGDTLVLALRVAGATYTGVLSADGDTLAGSWAQGPASLPLEMRRVTDEEASAAAMEGLEAAAVPPPPTPADRPQTPRPPFPYAVEEVRFSSAEEGVELAGTLTVPEGAGPFPAVVLVSGSGPQDRDETLLGHKPFAVLADYLTRRGIAVLRYDDRGVAESGGDFASATTVDLSRDAEGAVRFLAADGRVGGGAVGIVGHSEGGLIAPMVAARAGTPGFLVLLAGPGTTGEEILLDQARLIGTADGAPAELVESGLAVNRRLFAVLRETPDVEEARSRMLAILRERIQSLTEAERAMSGLPEGQEEGYIQAQVAQLATPWFRFFLSYDPAEALEATRVPVLALNGELDLQVPAGPNLEAIAAALDRGGNPDATTRVLPGLNHLFQAAATGSPAEYAEIDETMNEAAMSAVAEWILARFGPASPYPPNPASPSALTDTPSRTASEG
jgi:fermentation-respiration switch protein FrsA (DUF1100 family)